MKTTDITPSAVYGDYVVEYQDENGKVYPLFEKNNLILYTWGWIAARCIGLGDAAYKVAAGYLEFENNQTAGNVSIPSYGREDAVAYFNGLTGEKDYFRTPLVGTPTLDKHPASVTLLPTAAVNRVNFSFAIPVGVRGQRGKIFSNSNQSVLYGLSLVATPLWSDSNQDVILARSYFDTSDQIAAPATGQINVTWRVSFR